MRSAMLLAPIVALAAVTGTPSRASETLSFAKAPAWVTVTALPEVPAAVEAPFFVLLHDQQIKLEKGLVTTYTEGSIKILRPEGLAAGNVSISWDPGVEKVTVNRLELRRGNQIIDVLASGQTFTTMRREANLDAAMFDGMLTANIQPEDLQVGDLLTLATTTERADPTMKGHVESVFANWDAASIGVANARLIWPASLDLRIQATGDLPAIKRSSANGLNEARITLQNAEPVIAPKGAPVRYSIGRLGEATDFRSWSEVAALMLPLYREASRIPAAGALRAEVDRMKAITDPRARAEAALQLVQERIRYVALTMGEGSYVPASAEVTWTRRFGDCKAKTALLLGILRELEIEAEPVLVHSSLGDMIADRLPMVSLFDHVLVRARVGGKTHWLDGTRTGDLKLDAIPPQTFGWVLPVSERAELVRIVPDPLASPERNTTVAIDASKGIRTPAPIVAKSLFRGDAARALSSVLSSGSKAQQDDYLRSYWRSMFDFVTVDSVEWRFDRPDAVLDMQMKGSAKLDWSDGYFHVPLSSVGGAIDLERPAGKHREAPFLVPHPSYWATTTTLQLPKGFLRGNPRVPPDVSERLAGVDYRRITRKVADSIIVETSVRSLVPEVSHAEARKAEPRLRALGDEDISLRVPATYVPTATDMKAISVEEPTSAKAFVTRGALLLDQAKYDDAIKDFDKAIAMAPDDPLPFANRAVAYAWKQEFAAARDDLARTKKLEPDHFMLPRATGLLAEMQGDFAAAVKAYSEAIEIAPSDIFSLLHRASMYRQLQQDEKALEDLTAALKFRKSDPQIRLSRANLFLARRDRKSAGDEASRMIEENPEDSFAHVAAGLILSRLGRTDESREAFETALELAPEAWVYVNRSRSYPLADRSARLADLDRALKIEPSDGGALSEKADMLVRMGDHAGALQILDRAIAAEPDWEQLRIRRAVVLHKLGRTAEAEKILAERRERAQSAADLNELCWQQARANILLQAAHQDCRASLALQPRRSATLDSLGLVLLRLGRLEEALNAYDTALSSGEPSGSSLFGRAFVHARMGNRERAQGDRAAALELDPDVETSYADYGLTLTP